MEIAITQCIQIQISDKVVSYKFDCNRFVDESSGIFEFDLCILKDIHKHTHDYSGYILLCYLNKTFRLTKAGNKTCLFSKDDLDMYALMAMRVILIRYVDTGELAKETLTMDSKFFDKMKKLKGDDPEFKEIIQKIEHMNK